MREMESDNHERVEIHEGHLHEQEEQIQMREKKRKHGRGRWRGEQREGKTGSRLSVKEIEMRR